MTETRVAKWYFGGFAASAAACFTHPLDLLKVHLQTTDKGKMNLFGQTVNIVKKEGVFKMWNGLSASILRQMTYSLTRFAIYEVGKQGLTKGKKSNDIPFSQKIILAGTAGAIGGFVGTPGDLINVRMQNDIKIPLENRRNYKHALDGIVRVFREEGFTRLFSGASTATSRAVFVTIGQISFYEQVKVTLLNSGYFKDNFITHFLSSLTAGTAATLITQPLDVLKTRQMNAKPGEYRSLLHLITSTGQLGPSAFFKGFIPAFIRLGPHTILLFLFFEQMRINFGDVQKK